MDVYGLVVWVGVYYKILLLLHIMQLRRYVSVYLGCPDAALMNHMNPFLGFLKLTGRLFATHGPMGEVADGFLEVPLYGGAMLADMPKSFADASQFREVPDHQEVWVDTSSDRSVIIEILEKKDVPDEEAMEFFLADLAAFNDAKESKLLSTRSASPEEVPHLNCRVFLALGQQMAAKFQEEDVHPVTIHAAVLRLPEVDTDILITLNDPEASDESSGILAQLLKTFRIADWQLFGWEDPGFWEDHWLALWEVEHAIDSSSAERGCLVTFLGHYWEFCQGGNTSPQWLHDLLLYNHRTWHTVSLYTPDTLYSFRMRKRNQTWSKGAVGWFSLLILFSCDGVASIKASWSIVGLTPVLRKFFE